MENTLRSFSALDPHSYGCCYSKCCVFRIAKGCECLVVQVVMRPTSTLQTPLHCNALLVHSGQIICGMYEHVPAQDVRFGQISTIGIDETDAPLPPHNRTLRIDSDLSPKSEWGVFDMRHGSDGVSILVASTDGLIRRVTSSNGPSDARISEVTRHEPTDVTLATSAFDALDNATLVSTHHQGQCALWDRESNTLIARWEAHEFDAWTGDAVAMSSFLTGGDDGKLKLWDTRVAVSRHDSSHKDVAPPVAAARFDAGVVSVLGPPGLQLAFGGGYTSEHHCLVGTYDEHVYLMDLRALSRGPVASISVGGGAWRLRLLPGISRLFVAAMHGGAVELRFDPTASDDSVFTVLNTFHTHVDDALVYDVVPLRSRTDGSVVVCSASFYHNSLCLWQLPPDNA